MAELNRDRTDMRQASSSSVLVQAPKRATGGRRPRTRWQACEEPSLDDVFADPIFRLILRRDRLTLPDVMGVIDDARKRLSGYHDGNGGE